VQRTTILALSLVSLGSLLPLACTQNFGFFEATAGTGASTSSSSTSSSHTSSSSGSPACTEASDCDDDNACTTDTCASGKCKHTPLMNGAVPGYVDMVKDCKTENCVGGVEKTVADDTDVPPSTSQCVTVSCMSETVIMTDNPLGQSCGGTQKCDGQGNCVGCTGDADCTGAGTCQTAHCMTGVCTNTNDASGTMCTGGGGQVCDGNGNCVGCVMDSDCPSGNCQNNNTCGLAGQGHACTASNQCTSMHCANGVCCNHTCAGTCMACTAALNGGTDGTCGNVMQGTAPVPPTQCTAAPPCGNDGTCNGNAACEVPTAGTACGMVTCTGDMLTAAGTCDGTSACTTGAATSCDPYTCMTGSPTCRTTCTPGSTTDCSTGNYCETLPVPACVPQLMMGVTCLLNIQCLDGMCVAADGGGKVCN
jgi:hypothetical protein